MACARSLQCTPRIWCDLPPAPLWIVSVHSMEFWSNLHASEVMKITLTWWINHTCIWKSHLHDVTISNLLDHQHMTSMSVSMTITWHQWHKPFIQAAASGSWAYAPISQGVAGLWASWYLAGISPWGRSPSPEEDAIGRTQCQVYTVSSHLTIHIAKSTQQTIQNPSRLWERCPVRTHAIPHNDNGVRWPKHRVTSQCRDRNVLSRMSMA